MKKQNKEKITTIFMQDNEDNNFRIVRRKDDTVLITAVKGNYSGTKKSWEYPKEFDLNKFINIMEKQGFGVVEIIKNKHL